MSRLVFRAQIHQDGIRGELIRQRRLSKNDQWHDGQKQDIRTIGRGHGFCILLRTEPLAKMLGGILKLEAIREQAGAKIGIRKYLVIPSYFMDNGGKQQIYEKISRDGYTEDFWQYLTQDNPDLATRLSVLRRQQIRGQVIEEFKRRLGDTQYKETSGDNSWQKWLYEHSWVFGVNYQQPLEKSKINIGGSMPDFLFPTLDGFVDILDIKLPQDSVVIEDRSHKGSWKWSKEANIALGQAVNYLDEIQRNRLEVEKNLKLDVAVLKPRAYIVIGDCQDWTTEQREGFRKLNSALKNIDFLTYRVLLKRAERLVD